MENEVVKRTSCTRRPRRNKERQATIRGAAVNLPRRRRVRPSVYFPSFLADGPGFAFPIARFVLPFFVSHLTVRLSFAASNFLRSSLKSSLARLSSPSLPFSLSPTLRPPSLPPALYSRLRYGMTDPSRSLKGGVNEAARLSHGRSHRRGKQVRLALLAETSPQLFM